MAKRATNNLFIPKIYKNLLTLGLYIAQQKGIFSREIYENLHYFGLYIANKKDSEHFRMKYIPSPSVNQYKKDMVALSGGLKCFMC